MYEKKPLGEFADVQGGYAFDSDDFSENGYPVVKIAEINPPNISLGECERIPEAKVGGLERYRLGYGDVLMAMTGATIGKVGRIRRNKTAYLNQRVAKISSRKGRSVEGFVYAVVSSDSFRQKVENIGGGSAQSNISASQIESIEVPSPPLPVQRRIADILGALNDKIELNRRMNETLEEMAQTLYRHWFVDFEAFQDREFTDTEELGPIPEGWETQKVKGFGEVILGSTPSTKDEENYGSEYPFIKIPDMHEKVFVDETENYLSEKGAQSQHKRFLPPNSIVVSCIATPGLVTITSQKSQTNQQINSVIPNDETLREYLYLTFDHQSHRIKRLASGGTATAILNKTDFSNVELILPPSDVIQAFHKKCSKWFDLMKNNLVEAQTLAETRDYLLPKLISGEIEVEAAKEVVEAKA